MPADLLVVGHVVKDLLPGGWRLGGTAAYASLQGVRLGQKVAVVTSCAPDISPAEALPEAQWHVVPAGSTTTFENRYTAGGREQRVLETAITISAGHVPPSWREAPLVLLGPVIGDVDPDLGSVFPETSIVGLCAQGWLRRLEGGRVRAGSVDADAPWLIGDVVFVSEEDVDEPEKVEVWRRHVHVVVLTRGARGATVWDETGRHEVPAFPAREVDPTGAGDVFAASFLVAKQETGDNLVAGRFAAAAASLVVQGEGLRAIADRSLIEGVLRGAGAPAS